MKENVGFADSFIRLSLALVLLLLWIDGGLHGTWSVVGVLAAMILLLTGLLNWCPIWSALGIGTKK